MSESTSDATSVLGGTAVYPPVPRRVRWAAYAVPLCVLPSALWRIPLLVSGPPGCPGYQAGAGETVYIIALSVLSESAALLTIGLVRPWGEVLPSWIPVIGGRRVSVRAAVTVAGLGAAFVTAVTCFASVNYLFRIGPAWEAGAECALPTAGLERLLLMASYAPLLAWGPLLAAVTVSYYRRRSSTDRPDNRSVSRGTRFPRGRGDDSTSCDDACRMPEQIRAVEHAAHDGSTDPSPPQSRPIRSAARTRIGYAAAAWSLGYALLGIIWTLDGPGFPFGSSHDPDGERISILAAVTQDVAAPVIAVVGSVGAALALLMARRRLGGLVSRLAVGFGWTTAVALAVVIPDYRALMRIAYTPVVLIGLPFGWPPGATLAALYPWPVLNLFLLMLGGVLWGASMIAYQRRRRGVCGTCDRADATTGWTTPANAARWGRWATYVAMAIPCLYALTRWAWAMGIPLGVSREFLEQAARETPGIWWAGAALATLAVGGAVLTLGLVQHWGEIYPRWIPFLRGKPVRPRTAIIPATIVALSVMSAGLMYNRGFILGGMFPGSRSDNIATVGPELFWPVWGAALGAATVAYYLRRRNRCRCG